jgi:hypothetical protein
MADDIVQTIKVEVEGADEAATALEKIGEGASTSFEETAAAAETAGVSIEDFGRLSEKTQQAYIELSQRVQEESQQMMQATQELQQGAGEAGSGTRELGGGLDDVSEKSGVSSREMRGLGKIMKELGAGDAAMLAVTFGKIGSSLGALGVAALAVAMSVGGIAKFAKGVNETAKELEDLSKASGTSVESLKLLEGAFEGAGLSSKKFLQAMKEVTQNIATEAPKIGDEIASSANRATEAQNAVAKARSASLDSERQSAGFAVKDAQASLRSLELKRALLANSISKAEYDRRSHIEEREALDISIQKSRQAIETAQREKAIKDSMQPVDEIGAAQRKANEAQANSLGPVIEKYEQLSKGIKETIDPLTSLETRTKAVIAVMADFGAAGDGANFEKALPALAKMYDTMNALEKLNLDKVLKKVGLPEEVINSLHKGSAEFAKLQAEAARVKWARDELEDFGKAADGLGGKMSNLGLQAAGLAVRALKGIGIIEHLIIDPIIPAAQRAWDGIARLVTTSIPNAWQWIKDTAASVWESVKALAQQAWDGIVRLVTTAPGAAWQWIKDTAASVWESVKALAQQAYQSVVTFVTTAPGNAWQWIKDSFQSVLDWIAEKWAAFKQSLGGGGAPAPGGAAGGQVGGSAGFAGGGLLGGRGTGTSDSNLAWVSRGEFITPAQAVSQPGVLALLEALRLSGGNLRAVLNGMGHFALGGMVRAPISIPAFAGGGMHNVTIQFPGLPDITGLRASSAVVDQLRQAAAMAQVRSGGRKPSRYS